ncbi:MAG TPA: CHRD domain-containing protein, partial [Bacteroidia bacterium]|nr:CHRD domain-containing protein [Bacteroidia bacterium]
MKKLLFTIITTALTSYAAIAVQLGNRLLLTAKLNGAQESPAVTTNAIGVGSFLLNAAHDSLCVDVTVTGLSGPITGAHIHTGTTGISGPVLKDLSTFVNGNSIKTVIYGTDLSSHLSEYLNGGLYINVHTNAHTDGEIRGQILLETDWSFVSSLDGAQLIPSSNTAAYGLGIFTLSKDSSKIKYNIIVEGASGALTEARLNYGVKGVNGPEAINITSAINGNAISGVITSPTKALIDSLIQSKVYIDLGTTMHPNGTELRGQLNNEKDYLYFDALLNGQQEVPVITTAALGVASIKLSTAFDTLWY